jgi:hypothetical protein
MHGLGNYFDGSCLKFSPEHDLFIEKLGKLCNWWVNSLDRLAERADLPGARARVEAMDKPTWDKRKAELVKYDRTLSTS